MKKVLFVCLMNLCCASFSMATLPTDLSGLYMWFDASTIGAADGFIMPGWGDSSGNGRHTTAWGSPTYCSTKFNGYAAVEFDPEDGFLTNDLVTELSGNPDFTVMMAVQTWPTGPYNHLVSWGGGTALTGSAIEVEDWGSPNVEHSFAYGEDAKTYQGNWANISPGIISTRKDLGQINLTTQIKVNGVTQVLRPDSSIGTPDILESQFSIGGMSGFVTPWMDVAEVIVFDRALTEAEEIAIGYYLEQKYSLDTAYVPEPASLVMLGIGALALRRRR